MVVYRLSDRYATYFDDFVIIFRLSTFFFSIVLSSQVLVRWSTLHIFRSIFLASREKVEVNSRLLMNVSVNLLRTTQNLFKMYSQSYFM